MSVHIPARVRSAALMPPAVKAGPVVPGAGVLMTEYLLPTILGTEPQQRMARSLKIGMEVDWVRAAEPLAGRADGDWWATMEEVFHLD